MESGRYVFISSYFSRCWVISPLLTYLKSCLWLNSKTTFCRFGAKFSAGGSECVRVHQFLQAFVSAYYLLQIYLAFCLWLLIDTQRCLLCISFSLPLFISKKQIKTSVNCVWNLSCCSVKQRGLKVRPPYSALPPALWYEFAVGIIHALSSSLLDRHRTLCFYICHFTSRFTHKRQLGEIMYLSSFQSLSLCY